MNVYMQQNFKVYIILMAALMLAGQFPAQAENWGGRSSRKHEVRIGWGDQMFEKLVWQNPQYIISNMPETASYKYKEHYRYSQHWFAEYQWRVNQWFGLGAMVDASGIGPLLGKGVKNMLQKFLGESDKKVFDASVAKEITKFFKFVFMPVVVKSQAVVPLLLL